MARDHPLPSRCDVVVVGAGLAGLASATHLSRAGLEVAVVEASDAVGGRVRTDVVDGFRLDRGFQVLNTAYPEVRRMLDLPALSPRRFSRAAVLFVDGRRVRVADPRREPRAAPALLSAPMGGLRGKLTLAAYAGLAATLPAHVLRSRADRPAYEEWRRRGIPDSTVDRVLRPFFSGVVLEEDMDTSSRFVELMMRMFARGDSVVPALGMQQMAAQLAAALPDGTVHLRTTAGHLSRGVVDTDRGAIRARAVIVATDADTARRFVGALPATRWKGVTTIYHATEDPPMTDPVLLLDTEATPVNNTVVVSAAAPTYAPAGRALVATSIVHRGGKPQADENVVRRRLSTLYGTSTRMWEHIATYDVPRALPSMTAPHTFRKAIRHGDVYVCGDHRDTSSIQGALVSGRRAAAEVLGDLAVRPDDHVGGTP